VTQGKGEDPASPCAGRNQVVPLGREGSRPTRNARASQRKSTKRLDGPSKPAEQSPSERRLSSTFSARIKKENRDDYRGQKPEVENVCGSDHKKTAWLRRALGVQSADFV